MIRNLISNSASLSPKDSHHAAEPVLSLEIHRGRTMFPCRPISKDRFLIGSGTACDLRLGCQSVPTVHSVIHTAGRDVWIESLATAPSLKINGQTEQSRLLHEGDRIEIGPFQFRVLHRAFARSTVPSGSDAGKSARPPIEQAESSTAPNPLQELSASDLVELLETEQHFVEQFENGRAQGAEALLNAARKRADAKGAGAIGKGPAAPSVTTERFHEKTDADPIPLSPKDNPADDGELLFLHELAGVVEQRNGFSDELERRCERISQRESDYVGAAANQLAIQQKLVAIQQKLAAQLERLFEQLETPQSQGPAERRAVA